MYEYYSKQCQFYLDVFVCIDIFIFTHNADIIQVRDQAIVMVVSVILQTTFDPLIKCTECQKAKDSLEAVNEIYILSIIDECK